MSKKRMSYSREFKREAMRLVTGEGYKISKAARRVGSIGTTEGADVMTLQSDSLYLTTTPSGVEGTMLES